MEQGSSILGSARFSCYGVRMIVKFEDDTAWLRWFESGVLSNGCCREDLGCGLVPTTPWQTWRKRSSNQICWEVRLRKTQRSEIWRSVLRGAPPVKDAKETARLPRRAMKITVRVSFCLHWCSLAISWKPKARLQLLKVELRDLWRHRIRFNAVNPTWKPIWQASHLKKRHRLLPRLSKKRAMNFSRSWRLKKALKSQA